MSEAELLYQSRFRAAEELFQKENKKACFDICKEVLQEHNVPHIFQARAHYYLSGSTSDQLYHAKEAANIYRALLTECRTVASHSKTYKNFTTAKARLVEIEREQNKQESSAEQYYRDQHAKTNDISNAPGLEDSSNSSRSTISGLQMTSVLSEKDGGKNQDLLNKITHPIVRVAAQAFVVQDYPQSFAICRKIRKDPSLSPSVKAMIDELLGRIAHATAAPHVRIQESPYHPTKDDLSHAQQVVDYYKKMYKELPADKVVEQVLNCAEAMFANVQKIVEEKNTKDFKELCQLRIQDAQNAYIGQDWQACASIAQDLLEKPHLDVPIKAKAHMFLAAVSMITVPTGHVPHVSKKSGLWHAQRAVIVYEKWFIASHNDQNAMMNMKAAKVMLAGFQEKEKKCEAGSAQETENPATEAKKNEASQGEEHEASQEETMEAAQGKKVEDDDWVVLNGEETNGDRELVAEEAACILM